MENSKYVIKLCNDLIESNGTNLELVREIASFRNTISISDPSILGVFIGVSSETDHLPQGSMRQYCSNEFLERSDKEKEEYLSRVRDTLVDSCRNLITELSNNS